MEGTAHGTGIHIALAAEKLGEFFGIPITNTLITSWIVVALLLVLSFLIGRNLKLIPGKLQTLVEAVFVYIYDYISETLENKKLAKRFFPLLVTIFLFVFTANILEFTPGIGSLGFMSHGEFLPLFRSVNTDLNVTLALSIIAFFVIQMTGILTLGALKYGGKFVNFRSPMSFFIGIIELFSEMARLVSFSFRLFGNIFAGEVLILVVAFFVPYLLPVPLMLFEVFVGFIQAAIFALLTLFFIKIAIAEPH
ncbi:MAG: ATP synthase F0 subunit A [Candidatus Harrisonbacteria bacterium CG10_big_fil_rev_8_21_14_0_10_42_17]|uniref:ATP synthase subunit a n=1 Tax=Candidatus Harrisonbacteria bacterium CG10_big_fil_rev_8_21_14_0_10_42_17 TaxID=1974584 RepID=A0A2M6WI97_9BACT|nr:MAG: ATP synthase F0 subunit A [Candidatus Harrisonbacteria bacterium CG10_big_fil_rev_8_21_14_0_10_42_17]